ncbi:MAG: Rne/Rng family ribonuclease [Planctomycetota bacterium]|nr:Rne/Rng family ribonuclease [Planctomycetota bacterium]
MLINAIDPEESRIAVVEDGVLQELHVELASREAYLGNIYKGKVVNIEPSIGAAFVAFGGRVNGFLHVSDVLPAYGRDDFRLEDVIEGRARVDVDDGPESMQQARSDDDDDDESAEKPKRPRRKASAKDAERDSSDAATDEATAAGDADDSVEEAVDAEPHGEAVDAIEEDAREADEAAVDVEAVDEVELVEGDVEAAGSDEEDAGGGFGLGLDGDDDEDEDGERPLEMAAADHEDGGDEAAEPAAAEASSSEGASGDADADPDGEAPRKKRSRRSRSRGRRKAAADGAADAEAEAGVAEQEAGAEADAGDVAAPEAKQSPRKKRSRRATKGAAGAADRRAPRGNRPTIDQLLRKGQEVVVQITKEGIGSKGPTLTTYVSLPGRSLVLMPSLPKCGVSRKIEDGKERRRLKRIVRELDETGSGGIGFIVRTAGINKSLDDIQRDRDYLNKIWEMVAQRLKVTKAPALLYQESDLVLKAMRDQFTPDIADVVVDSEDVYLRIRDFAEKLMPVMAERIKQHSVTTPLFHSFGIEKDVEALYEPQVDISNGASIVIDQAEALVAIDVNSGKYKAGGHGSDETAYRTNLEAIPEIVRQLRLRDLGGLIIIDFIDMSPEKHRRSVERKMIDALRGDRARIKVGRISPFGMMEITRQRVGPGLKRTVFMQCTHCKGAGWSRTVQSKALSVLREVRALVHLKGYSMLQVFVAPPVADYLVNFKRRAVLELEDAVGKTVLFRPEQSYPIDVVHYRFLTGDGQEARIAIPAGLGVKA